MKKKYSDSFVKKAIVQAKESSKNIGSWYNCLEEIREGEMWNYLTPSQKRMVEKAFK